MLVSLSADRRDGRQTMPTPSPSRANHVPAITNDYRNLSPQDLARAVCDVRLETHGWVDAIVTRLDQLPQRRSAKPTLGAG